MSQYTAIHHPPARDAGEPPIVTPGEHHDSIQHLRDMVRDMRDLRERLASVVHCFGAPVRDTERGAVLQWTTDDWLAADTLLEIADRLGYDLDELDPIRVPPVGPYYCPECHELAGRLLPQALVHVNVCRLRAMRWRPVSR